MAQTTTNNETLNALASTDQKLNYFRKLWRYRHYLVVEPFVFFYVMASVFNSVAIMNFPLDKACRVNLGYNKAICDATLDKSQLGINCDNFNFKNTTTGALAAYANIGIFSDGFNYTVCKAEVEAQILAADVSGKRAPVAAIFSLIVLLFAGGWSDRYNKRKPCLIVPIVGEALGFVCLFISAIFFDSLPMEFGAYCEAIVPALFGGLTFCIMAVYSYITITTPEEDRIFRFGIFAMFLNGMLFLGQPLSGFLFKLFGYKWSFAVAIAFQFIAILYIIFFINEINGQSPYQTSNLDEVQKNINIEMSPQMGQVAPPSPPPKRSLLWELFDPTLVIDCIKFPLTKRENNGRILLILLILAYFLTIGPGMGEGDYWYRYTLKKLNWNGSDYSFFSTFVSGLALVGTFLGTAILSKIFKVPDSMIGMLSALSIVLSRILFAFAKDTASFYIAGILDLFVSLRMIAIKTIGSSIVDGEELSKMYSIFGISDPISSFIFPPIYSAIYQQTVDSFPGAIWLFGELFYVPNVLVFILCYFLLRRNKKKKEQSSVESQH